MTDLKENLQKFKETYDLIDQCAQGNNDAMDKFLDMFLYKMDDLEDEIVKYVETKSGAYAKTLLGFIKMWKYDDSKIAASLFIQNMQQCIYAYVGMAYIYINKSKATAKEYAMVALNAGCNFACFPLSRYEYNERNYTKSLEYAVNASESGFSYGLFSQGRAYQVLNEYDKAFNHYSMVLVKNCKHAKERITSSPELTKIMSDKYVEMLKNKCDIEEYKNFNRALTQQRDTTTQIYDKLKKEYDELKERHDYVISSPHSKKNREIENLKEQNDNLVKDIDNLEKKVMYLSTQNDALTEKIMKFEKK
jgi:FtsZ-binding cell division protein ZapB